MKAEKTGKIDWVERIAVGSVGLALVLLAAVPLVALLVGLLMRSGCGT